PFCHILRRRYTSQGNGGCSAVPDHFLRIHCRSVLATTSMGRQAGSILFCSRGLFRSPGRRHSPCRGGRRRERPPLIAVFSLVGLCLFENAFLARDAFPNLRFPLR